MGMNELGGEPTASLRFAFSFRLIFLPQTCQPTTAATASMIPARQPPTIDATGIVTLPLSLICWTLEVADGASIVTVTMGGGDGEGEDIEGGNLAGVGLVND
jgi:hypothetical protein